MKIFIVGLPGSGKTTLGKAFARAKGIPFIDLDHVIEQDQGRPIARIFGDEGEEYFRKLESSTLQRVITSSENFILSTGGGAPCFHDNMVVMKSSGKVVFLDISPEIIVSRLSQEDISDRPLFASEKSDDLLLRLKSFQVSRTPFYLQADIVLSAEKATVSSLDEALKN